MGCLYLLWKYCRVCPGYILFLGILLSLFPMAASADTIGGTLELDYAHATSTAVDSSGLNTQTKSDTFFQRYNLGLDKTLYPNVKFAAGAIYDKSDITSDTDGQSSKSTTTTFLPSLTLTMTTPLLQAGTAFSRIENTASFGGLSSTNFRDSYTAFLGWSPVKLPALNVQYIRSYTYDKDRLSQDTVADALTAGLTYSPVKYLDLFYQGSYTNSNDKLTGLETQSIEHSLQARYSREFFDRVSLSTSGLFNLQETTTTTSLGQGEIRTQLLPFFGLSSLSDTPALVALDQNPALIDGNLTAGSGINIGPVPPGGNTKPRNIGLDFFNPSDVDTLFVWVDRQLPAIAVSSFSWDVYISSDNQSWTLLQTVPAAPFGTFDNRFEITFQKIKTRYIKVVVKPLSAAIISPPGFDLTNIFVTELQAFLQQPAVVGKNSSTTTSQQYQLSTRTRILDSPSLYHDLGFLLLTSSPGGSSYLLTNGFTITQRLSRIFTTAGRVAMEYSKQGDITSTAYVLGGSLMATPLPTLSHNLTVSGRIESTGGVTRNSKSVFLNNSAELYKGVDLSLSGGYSTQSLSSGQTSDTTSIIFGATFVPNPKLTVSLDFSDSRSNTTGGGVPDSSSFVRNADISISSTPFKTVYLFASLGYTSQTNQKSGLLQEYAVSWSPLQGGALQVYSTYSQSLSSVDDSKLSTLVQGLRWNINRRASIDLNYVITKTTFAAETTDSKALSSTFRTAF